MKTNLNIISMQQFRKDFPAIKKRLQNGESFLLIHRSKPLAKIESLFQGQEAAIVYKKNAKRARERVKQLAGGFHLGKGLDPDEMNKTNASV